MGHVGCTDDAGMGYRTVQELTEWRDKCPILRLENDLLEDDPDEAPSMLASVRRYWTGEISRALDLAKEAAYAVD
jgi:TPP-dependent pyruvate/acetoin dehydrogenase alpha subunit